MGIFFAPKKRILPDEFRDIKRRLRQRGLSTNNIEEVEAVAEASLRESGSYAGIDRREKEQLLNTLREHRSTNHLTDEDLEIIDKTFEEEL